MEKLSIDIETYSDVDLAKAGVYRYVESPAFEILLFGVSVDGGPLTGTFWVTRATDRWPARVTSIDATLWDRTADYGFVYGPRDLSVDVVNGQAELDVRTVPERRRALVEDYLDEVRAALAAAAANDSAVGATTLPSLFTNEAADMPFFFE